MLENNYEENPDTIFFLIQRARNYLTGQMIADELTGRRSSLDAERTNIVRQMDFILRRWREEYGKSL